MGQNYLNGKNSSQINTFLAATGWNLKKMMKKLKLELEKIFNYLKFHFLSKIMFLNFDFIRNDYLLYFSAVISAIFTITRIAFSKDSTGTYSKRP